MPDDEELLGGGNVGQVVRRGDRVHRETGPWSPAVHRLLRHLEGVTGVPRLHGLDEQGREVLDFLPGRIVDVDHEELSDAQLVATVAWTRRLHDATSGFADPGPWRFEPPAGADVVGHNDIAPYNLCFDGDDLVGVFDWDLAGPTTRLLELGWIAWSCVPLFWSPDLPAGADPDRWAVDRLRMVAETYGDLSAEEVLDATVRRVERSAATIRAAASAGDVGMQRLTETTGEPGPTLGRLAGLRGRLPALRAALRRPLSGR